MPQFFCQISGSDEISKKRIHGKGRRPRGGEAIGMCEAVRLNILEAPGIKRAMKRLGPMASTASFTFCSTAKRRANAPNPVSNPG